LQDTGRVLFVHVLPVGDVFAIFPPSGTAQNTDPFHATDMQLIVKLLFVHVTPSGDVSPMVVPYPGTKNTDPFHAIA
jgi:hypothetical protein